MCARSMQWVDGAHALQVTVAEVGALSSVVKMECEDAAAVKVESADPAVVKAEAIAPASAAKENVAPMQTPVNKLLGRALQAPGSGMSPSQQ